MDFAFLNNLVGQIFHLFVWSTFLALAVLGCIRLNPSLQYWPALWKVTLLLCLLPLLPWSHLELNVVEFPVAYQLLSEMPTNWVEGSVLTHSADNYVLASAKQKAIFHLLGLTVLSVMLVSLFKTILFIYKILRFNRLVAGYPPLDKNCFQLACLSESQKADLQSHNIRILASGGSTSPFATGLFRPCIVLPKSFFNLPVIQQKLLIEHEITHIKHRDLNWLMLSQLVRCLLWFIPTCHLIKAKLELSIEVECDRKVLGTYPHRAKDYGSALISVVKQTKESINPQAAFFNNQQFSDLKTRIKFTQKPPIEYGKQVMNKLILAFAAVLFSATSWALNTNVEDLMPVEDFVKLHKLASRSIDDKALSFEPSGTWVNPVESSWVSSKFRAKQKIRQYKPHLGIDLAAELGDSIVAANDGVVIIADSVSLHKDHGNVVIVDHGNGTLSMYSHMDSYAVEKGDSVKAGQLLGKVGVSGKSTGPHLHFEVIAANRHIDPASIIEFN